MEEEDGERFRHAYLSPFVSRASFFNTSVSPSSRRLSSNFGEQNRSIPLGRRLSLVNLEGRFVNAEKAWSSNAVGGYLSIEESIALDLFSPLRRLLIWAVVAVATADLNKSQQVWKLQRSRNEVPLNMQLKCGCRLCDQHQRNHSEEKAYNEDEMFKFNPLMLRAEQEERRMSDLSDSHSNAGDLQLNMLAIEQDIYNLRKENEEKEATIKEKDATIKELTTLVKAADAGVNQKDSVKIGSSEEELFKFKPLMIEEQEERRMSDLSDFAYSVTSAADIQLNTPAVEHDIEIFLREFEEKDATIKEKDATIKELLAVVKATDVGCASQRVLELEELVRRQNLIITKQKKDMSVMRKDMAVMEQKIVHLTRLRRPSTASTLTIKELPTMADNLLYDMSSTSPSSSDSDSPIENQTRVSVNQEHKITPPQDVAAKRILETPSAKHPMSLPKSTYRHPRSRPVSPLTENSMNQRLDSPSGYMIRNRRRSHSGSAQSKRWV